ncbi:hypothetical protein BURPS1655_K0913 [Burkholderia pseudomallei 1655]|nr:hypothetical protein BURPS1655_K0913 [Burkholderia pseudomallei 1655]
MTPGRRGVRRARAPVPARSCEPGRRRRRTSASVDTGRRRMPIAVPGEVVKPDAGRYHRRSVIATWRDVARWASARHGGGGGVSISISTADSQRPMADNGWSGSPMSPSNR